MAGYCTYWIDNLISTSGKVQFREERKAKRKLNQGDIKWPVSDEIKRDMRGRKVFSFKQRRNDSQFHLKNSWLYFHEAFIYVSCMKVGLAGNAKILQAKWKYRHKRNITHTSLLLHSPAQPYDCLVNVLYSNCTKRNLVKVSGRDWFEIILSVQSFVYNDLWRRSSRTIDGFQKVLPTQFNTQSVIIPKDHCPDNSTMVWIEPKSENESSWPHVDIHPYDHR